MSVRLTTVSAAWFKQLARLEILNLGNVQLITIAAEAFDGLNQLMTLNLQILHSNRLTTVSAAWFSQLTRLQLLKLGDKQMETIPDDAFDGLNQIKYLHETRLTTLSPAVSRNTPCLASLSLHKNPLNYAGVTNIISKTYQTHSRNSCNEW